MPSTKNADSSSASAEAAEGDDAASNSDYDDDDQEDIMTKAIRVLEEDCRKLRVEKWVDIAYISFGLLRSI